MLIYALLSSKSRESHTHFCRRVHKCARIGGIELNPDNASISLLLVKLIFIWVKNLTFRNSQLHLATILGTKTVKVPRRDPLWHRRFIHMIWNVIQEDFFSAFYYTRNENGEAKSSCIKIIDICNALSGLVKEISLSRSSSLFIDRLFAKISAQRENYFRCWDQLKWLLVENASIFGSLNTVIKLSLSCCKERFALKLFLRQREIRLFRPERKNLLNPYHIVPLARAWSVGIQ